MTWPSSDVNTTGMDAGTDTPPRAEFLSWAQKFNQIRSHVSNFMQGLLTSADAAAARTTLGATTTGSALFTAADAAAARQAAGVPNSGPLSGLRNLVINGNFSVNQRSYTSGTATTGANQYTLDRWRVVTSGQAATFTTTGAGRTVTAPSGGIEQVIEGASIGGGTYVVNWTGTAACTVNGTARAKGATFTLTAGSNATVRFSSGTVTDVQIEPGEVATAFELRPAAVERMLCQQYYRVLRLSVGFHSGAASTPASVPAIFSPAMRTAPTMTNLGNVAQANVSSHLYENISETGARFTAVASGSGYAFLVQDVACAAEL